MVPDILFTGKDAVLPSSALNKNYITNFTTLRSMGDKLMSALAKSLNLSGGTTPPTTTPPSGSCSWAGHCAGIEFHDQIWLFVYLPLLRCFLL